MPELPEVTTTVNGLNSVLPKLAIRDVWSDYYLRAKNPRKDTIKNRKYFEHFKNEIIGEKVTTVERRGKNILIHLTHGKTILIHMKMTGHLLYGSYRKLEKEEKWLTKEKGVLEDSFNQFLHLVFTLSNGKHVAFSDMRKFAKVILFETEKRVTLVDISSLGPEPLDNLSFDIFKNQIHKRKTGKIKSVLMDQTIIAGIGNIYSDEILWASGVHPERRPESLSEKELKAMWNNMKIILSQGIEMGGDSMSDYRNIYGERGNFQNSHKAYRRTKEKCLKKGCRGVILRKVIGGRSAHFCSIHQK